MSSRHRSWRLGSALLALAVLAAGCLEPGGPGGSSASLGGKADEGGGGGGGGGLVYSCQVIGSFVDMDGVEAAVEAEGFLLEVGGENACLTEQGQIDCNGLDWGDPLPWSLSLRVENDGGESPMVLSLLAPNQNAAVGMAYAEPGSAYIGFVHDSMLEALCRLEQPE